MWNAPMTEKESKKFIKKLHPNLWKRYRDQYNETGIVDLRHDTGLIAQYRNIKSIFGDEVIQWIKDHLDKNEPCSWYKYYSGNEPHLGRDYTIEISTSPDGFLSGHFSSEYPGFGNGDYYLLVNETTAIFIEKD